MGNDDHHKQDAKNIATGVVGGIGGSSIANAVGLGGVGNIAGGVLGSIGAGKAEGKAEEKAKK